MRRTLALRGRRGGGGGAPPTEEPLDLGSDLRLWLRADRGLAVSGVDVTSWSAYSGSGSVVKSYTPASGTPDLVGSAINGKPGVLFPNTASTLSNVAETEFAAPWTWIAVVATSGVTVGGAVVLGSGAASNAGVVKNAATTWTPYTYAGSQAGAGITATGSDTAMVLRLDSEPSALASVNGVTAATIGVSSTLSLGYFGLPTSGTLTLCEFLVVSTAAVNRLKPYILERYAIPLG